MEIFYEQFLHNSKTKIQVILNNVLMFFLILSGIFLVAFNLPMAILSIVVYAAIFFYCRQTYVEYEYELTNDELEISKILNQKKRKSVAKIDLNKVIAVEKFEAIKNRKDIKFKRCFLRDTDSNVDVLMVKDSNGTIGYKLTMDKQLKVYCRRVNPKVFINIV